MRIGRVELLPPRILADDAGEITEFKLRSVNIAPIETDVGEGTALESRFRERAVGEKRTSASSRNFFQVKRTIPNSSSHQSLNDYLAEGAILKCRLAQPKTLNFDILEFAFGESALRCNQVRQIEVGKSASPPDISRARKVSIRLKSDELAVVKLAFNEVDRDLLADKPSAIERNSAYDFKTTIPLVVA